MLPGIQRPRTCPQSTPWTRSRLCFRNLIAPGGFLCFLAGDVEACAGSADARQRVNPIRKTEPRRLNLRGGDVPHDEVANARRVFGCDMGSPDLRLYCWTNVPSAQNTRA